MDQVDAITRALQAASRNHFSANGRGGRTVRWALNPATSDVGDEATQRTASRSDLPDRQRPDRTCVRPPFPEGRNFHRPARGGERGCYEARCGSEFHKGAGMVPALTGMSGP